jgi:hypothetical protein
MTETTAVVMSWFILFLGLSYLLQARRWATWIKEYGEQAGDLYLTLLFALFLLAGLVVVSTHNIWVLDWPVVITIFGWGMVIKSVLLLVAPPTAKMMADWWAVGADTIRLGGIAATLLGAILVYQNVLAG